MALLQRISSGLIFKDEFTGTTLDASIWIASPSNLSYFDLNSNPGTLTIYPDSVSGNPVRLLAAIPDQDFVIEIQNDYIPSSYGDMAGITLYQNETNKADLMQYYDSASGYVVYTHLRVQRTRDTYIAWGSLDGGRSWTVIGTATGVFLYMGISYYAPVVLGATPLPATPIFEATPIPSTPIAATPILSATPSPFFPLDIDYVHVFGGTGIAISNASVGMTARLLSADGTLLVTGTCPSYSDRIVLDVMNIPLPLTGYLQIYDANGVFIEQTPAMELWGGDVFWFGLRLQVTHNGNNLSEDSDCFLGMMQAGTIQTQLLVTNNNTIPANNVSVTIEDLVDNPGGSWTTIAPDVNGAPGTFGTVISIGTIQPGQTIPFWLYIQRGDAPIHFDGINYRFKLQLHTN